MKARINYVSNSSSSSFIIFNWFDLSEQKRKFIKDYDKNALKIWNENKIPYNIKDGLLFFDKEDISLDISEKEQKRLIKYIFGYVEDSCKWFFLQNKKRNACKVTTIMDNFDMEIWLKYNKVDFEGDKD